MLAAVLVVMMILRGSYLVEVILPDVLFLVDMTVVVVIIFPLLKKNICEIHINYRPS